MKIKTFALALLLGTAWASADEAPISPLPQSITVGTEVAFTPSTVKFTQSTVNQYDSDAEAIIEKLKTDYSGSTSVDILIGEADNAAVSAYESKIPSQAEGYYLSVTPGKVVIAGRDKVGTFYGVQSLLQLLEQPTVYSTEVTDYPTMSLRGTIEGFYGNPWSHADRLRQFAFYARNKMNIYVYGPKDDPYHHSQWYNPYPDDKAAELKELIEYADQCKVRFVWAMHPSNSIESDSDKQKALDKFAQMYNLGVRNFGIFFDDIAANSVQAQIDYLNYLTDEFVKKHDDVNPLIVCPTHYNSAFAGWNGDSYLKPMGAGLYPEIEIMWTGQGVCNMIGTATCEWFTNYTGRKPFIWLNYPVNDYGGHSLLMGPFRGNDPAIKTMVSAFCSNPMQYAEASLVALYGLADFAWNPDNFDADTSWERSLKYFQPEHTAAFRTFCLNNVDYYQSSHGLKMEGETPGFTSITANSVIDYAPFFTEQVSAADELLAIADQDFMLTEVKEWVEALKLQGTRGNALVTMQTALNDNKPEEFIEAYKTYKEATETADNLVSRNFSGSIQSVHVTTGMAYVEPYILSTASQLVNDFKATGAEYPEGLFPAQMIENGNYYIIVDGKYLSNGKGSSANTPGNPTLLADRDDINPNRQVWKIRIESTGRYSLRSAHDDRYVNEILNFGTNPYSDAWNTYIIQGLNGYYSIQNAGSGGKQFWTKSGSKLAKGDLTDYDPANFIFEIVPVDEIDSYVSPAKFEGGVFTIQNEQGQVLSYKSNNDNKPVWMDMPETLKNAQKFTITLDTEVNRWKITNGTRYVNEQCIFGTNSYLASWNTYKLHTKDGKFSIGLADASEKHFGSYYWKVSDDYVNFKGTQDIMESFDFRFVDYNQSGIEEIGTEGPADGVTYDLLGRPVSHPEHGIYIQNGKKILVK